MVIYKCGQSPYFAFGGDPAPFGFAVGQADPPEEEERTLLVRAALNHDALGPAAGVGLPTQARVPLGGFLRLEAIDDLGQALPADFVLGTATPGPGVASTALFSGLTLIPYTGGPINGATYQAVHKGTVKITITPSNAEISIGTLTVIVEDPLRLGATVNDLDAAIVDVAHRTGVLPQFIKAHAEKESGARFNRFAYRYEPIGAWIGDLTVVSRGRNYRTQPPYSSYRLQAAPDELNQEGLAAGPLLTPSETDFRAKYRVACTENDPDGRAISSTDTLISAWEIFRCNDKTNAKENWEEKAQEFGPERAAALKNHPFTAQTSLAASYGLLQVTYVTAIDFPLRWRGDINQVQAPSLLFDSPENHQRGAGSLRVGTAKVVKDFQTVVGVSVTTPDILMLGFKMAWDRYNPGENGYGNKVGAKVPAYSPIPQAPVLGGVQ